MDLDGARFPAHYVDRVRFVMRQHRLTVDAVRIDRTRHGWHVIVYVRQRVSVARRVLLQSLLGSDWKRETFNSARALGARRLPLMWRDRRLNLLFNRHEREVRI